MVGDRRPRVGDVTDLDALPPPGAVVVERRAVRALVLDDRDRLLLFVGMDPDEPLRGQWWFTPGGGVEPGESDVVALVREVGEETGLHVDPGSVGVPVWLREAHFRFAAEWYLQREQFYLLRVASHQVDTSGFTPLEASSVLGHRWWTLEELATTHDVVYPNCLVAELAKLLAEGPPAQPYEITR